MDKTETATFKGRRCRSRIALCHEYAHVLVLSEKNPKGSNARGNDARRPCELT